MKKIRFNWRPDLGGYGCNYLGDHSGHYYQSTDVDDLMQEVRAVLDTVEEMLWNVHEEGESLTVACEGGIYKLAPCMTKYVRRSKHEVRALLAKLTPKDKE